MRIPVCRQRLDSWLWHTVCAVIQVPFNYPPCLNTEETHPRDRLLRFKNNKMGKKKKKKSGRLQLFSSAKETVKAWATLFSLAESAWQHSLQTRALFKPTATTVGHCHSKPLVNAAPSNYWDLQMSRKALFSTCFTLKASVNHHIYLTFFFFMAALLICCIWKHEAVLLVHAIIGPVCCLRVSVVQQFMPDHVRFSWLAIPWCR